MSTRPLASKDLDQTNETDGILLGTGERGDQLPISSLVPTTPTGKNRKDQLPPPE